MKPTLILDFDSTFIRLEALDTLADLSLADSPHTKAKRSHIADLTAKAMAGILPFDQALTQRLKLFQTNRAYITQLIHLLAANITPSIAGNQEWFKRHADEVYIISGGFKEYITPIVAPFGITPSHILANSFVFNQQGEVVDYDHRNLLAKENGKSKQLEQLNLSRPNHYGR